jgi:uncharacterized protein (TIGR00251 family)
MTSKKGSLEKVGQKSAFLTVKVVPRSSENSISEIQPDGALKIKITAPPVEGKANAALIKLLAEILSVNKSEIEIKSGQSSRMKIVRINGVSQEVVNQAVNRITPDE